MSVISDKEQLKEAILNKAFRGELTEQDYDEGTGRELLERIKSERQREQKGKKKVELAPVSKEEEPYELPPNWTWTRLGEVHKWISGVTFSKNDTSFEKEAGKVACVKTNHIQLYNFNTSNLVYLPREKVRMEEKFLKHGDVIMSSSNSKGSIGRCCIVEGLKEDVSFGAFVSTLRAEGILPHYLLHFLNSHFWRGTFDNMMNQTINVGNLRKSDIEMMSFPLPPLAEQHRIVAKIERAFELIDSMDVDSLLQDISDFRQEILTRAFRGDLTEQNFDEGTGMELLKSIQLERQTHQTKGKKKTELAPVSKEEEPYELPPNWTWTQLGEVSTLISGRDEAISQTNENGIGVPYIMGASNFKDGSINIERWIETPKVISLPEDILITVKGTVGKMMINKDETYNLSRQVMALRVTELKNTFIYYFLKYQMPTVSSQSNGVIPGISRNVLLDLDIPLPPLAEQHRIVAKIEAIFSALDVMEDAITKQKDEAKACYEEILRKEMGTDVEGEKELETTSEEMVEVRVG